MATSTDTPEQRRQYDLLLAGLDLLDQGLAVFDSGPRLVAWNKAFLALLELPESLAEVGTPFEAFIRYNAERGEYGPGDIDALVAQRVAAARAFQPHYTERARPNGKILSIRGVPIPNLGFVSLWTDITEQRRYEALIQQQNASLEARVRARTAELEQANSQLAEANAQLAEANAQLAQAKAEVEQIAGALRRSETRLQLIVDSIPALIAYVDREDIYQFANRGYAEWFGCGKDEIVGRSIREIFGEDAYAQIHPHLERAHGGERVSYEYSRKSAGGHTVHARSVLVPEAGADGEVAGLFVMSTDITEQKANQAALIQAQKMEAVGQLTGGLAHDFNNLLTIIIGNLSAIQAEASARPEYLEPAMQAARRGAELIKRLLSFSRRQTLEPTAVEVGVLVHNMSHLLVRSLAETIKVRLRLPGEPLHALVDPHQLENAILNLALNARDAMPEGGELTIAVSSRKLDEGIAHLVEVAPGDYVQIDISDTGCGIDPALLPRVFEPFFTTKPFGGGSGLGLAMVYGFLRQSGGNIRILSTPGRGTNVRFVLPMAPPPAPAPSPSSAPGQPAKLPGPVLLVEDEPEVRKVIRLQLLGLGHAVLEAGNGIEALALLEAVPDIAVLISDTVMPGGIGGPELAGRARALRPELPILLITGYASGNAVSRAGVELPVLRKPFDPAALAEALAEAITAAGSTQGSAILSLEENGPS
ncbi:PAS domain-containing protein [Azoarcus indigens]|uniref:histidine kinase n=1 Tax=Azoarcus indigens TaxID=29545 RepID=A0A4R6E3R5_9RHOO|nr:PAS-domain containing protein [Azoarcus indigens]NMG64614.1 PAS domain-containing protein [Azoarcus indigens]TDN52441.1 PAS/PAC sensor hybrid histidine kinase [Azoarcus indigens]